MLPVNQNYFFLDLIIGQLKYGYTGKEFNHSHPTNVPYPSGSFDDDRYGKIGTWGDVGFAKYVDFVFNGSPEFNIYVKPTKEYVPYNKNSQYSDFS